jgi:nitrogen fixation protein NifU and related proteins
MEMTDAERRIMAYWQNERYRGQLPSSTVHCQSHNPTCGDELQFDVSIRDGVITNIVFSGEACVYTMAVAAMLAEEFDGKPIEHTVDVLKLFGIPIGTNRKECVLSPYRELRKCLTG